MNGEEKRFLSTVDDYSRRHGLFSTKGLYLVALSGGADSVALLRAMLSLGLRVHAMHCNFHLRGTESDRDEQFCKTLCAKFGVELHLIHFDTTAYASLHHVSIEMAARDLRYTYFNSLASDLAADGICVAHHRDDCAETVLLNLIRGTGVHGLRGILPRNGNILRPLLCVGRSDIESYLASLSQEFVTDSTNLVNDVTRNKIRLDLMPLLEKINPNIKATIARSAEHIAEATRIIDSSIERSINAMKIASERYEVFSVDELRCQPSPEYVLFVLLNGYGFTPQQIKNVYDVVSRQTACSGKTWESSTHELLLDRGNIVVAALAKDTFKAMRIPETGTYIINARGDRLRVEKIAYDGTLPLCDGQSCICVDADKAEFPLTLRLVAAGDRFMPFGMNRSKLVSDFLTDRKRNLFDKRAQLVLTTRESRVVWLVNERIDNRCRVTPKTTYVLRISLL